MITVEKVTGVEGIAYLENLKEHAKNEQRQMGAAVKAGVAEEIAGYLDGSTKVDQDNGAHHKESQGRKLIFGEIAAPDLEAWKAKKAEKKGRKTPKPKQVESFGQTGERLNFDEAVLMGKGFHPKTGESLVQRNTENRTVGNDVQFGAPKSVSTIWALASSAAYRGSAEGLRYKEAIEAAQAAGVKRALQYAHDNGLLIARRSDAKHGHEGAGMVIFGQYDHFTNRNGEPHVHTHNMWFNVCVRSDGTTGTVDNRQLKAHAAIIGALYRMEMASELKSSLGLRASKVDRNFEIDGVSEELVAAFSTRRQEVVDYLAQMGIDNTAEHREAAKHASRNTRKSKDEQPSLIELYDVWDKMADGHGVSFETLTQSLKEAAAKKEASENEDWIAKQVENNLNGVQNTDVTRPEFDLNEIKARAYAAVVETNSAFAERRILKAVFEELQVYTNVDTAIKVVDDLIQSGDLIPLAKRKDDLYFTTAEIAVKEQGLVNDALSMLGNLEIMNPNVVRSFTGRQVVDDKGKPIFKEDGTPAYLKLEQIEGVKHACGGDQIVVVHGAAGSGKSKMLGTVADIHRHMGQEVHAIAPSHKAKQVIAADANIELEMARAVAGFISQYEKGNLKLSSKSTLIVDEAGMVGLDDMAKLVDIAKKTGARLILSGDKFQLPSIARGAPLGLLCRDDICGAAVLIEIVRQKDPRQREASVLMAKGKTADGLKHYVDTGRVSFTDDALKDTMTAYMGDREKNPAASRMIGVFRNAHATQLNLKTRDGLKEDGTLKGQGFTIGAWTRGLNQRVVDREFNEGEKIIFGETFRIGDMEISNNTTATILKIDMAGNEPVFTIRTEGPDPKTFTAKPSEMVGYRDEKAKDKTTPKIDYAYAQTVYSLQGSTFDRMFIYAGEAGNAELAYVMMTRHRYDCQVFVDRTRIYDELAAKAGKIMHLDKKTGAAPEENTTVDGEPTEEEIRATWIKENSASGRKLNVCDFHETVEEFLSKDFSKRETIKMEDDVKSQQNNSYAEAKGRVEQPAEPAPTAAVRPTMGRSMPRGMGPIGSPAPAPKAAGIEKPKTIAEQAREQLNNGKAGQAVNRAKEAETRRIEREKAFEDRKSRESNFLNKDVDLVDYAMSKGAFIKDGTEKSYILERSNGTEYTLSWGKGQGLVITKLNSGIWSFYDRSSKTAGGIVNFYQFVNNLPISTKDSRNPDSYKRAMEGLRQEFNLETRDLSQVSPSYSRTESGPKLTGVALHESKLAEAKAYGADKLKKVGLAWNIGLPIRNGRYSADLLSRGISRETQDRLAAQNVLKIENATAWKDWRNDGTRDKPEWVKIPNRNPDGWLVAMKTAWNVFTGYIRKGPVGREEGKRFSENGPSSQRALVRYGNLENPSRIVLDESISDSFTRFQRDNYPADTQYVATAGNPKDVEEAMVFDLARKHPGTEWLLGKQNDAANDRFRATMKKAIQDGDQTAKVLTSYDLPSQFKDISDQHKSENADQIKADLAALEVPKVQDQPKAKEEQQTPAAQPKASRPPFPPPRRPSKWDEPAPAPIGSREQTKIEDEERKREQEQRPKGPSR